MQIIIYFLISLIATTLGAMTGMGGGVIIKPVLDFLGDYNVASINILSSITVFSMAVVSTVEQVRGNSGFKIKTAVLLGVGSAFGGIAGNTILNVVLNGVDYENHVTIIQNVVQALLIVIVFIYMKNKDRIKRFHFSGPIASLVMGLTLGLISTFLGIGGGPINVAFLIFFMGNDTKTAVTNSIITILFSQAARLLTVTFTTGFQSFDLSILPYMVVGAIAGGMLGSLINKRMTEKTVDKAFNALQVLILFICVTNIVINILYIS